MSRGDAITLSGYLMETHSVCTVEPDQLKAFAAVLLKEQGRSLPLNVFNAATNALRW